MLGDILTLLARITKIEVLALHNIDTRLHRILVQCVLQKSADNSRLVIESAKEALLAIACDTGDCRVCACILSAQIVAHVSPHRPKILHDRVAAVRFEHERNTVSVNLRPVLSFQVKT